MNFGYMTTSQIASLIVAVVLTVVTFATTLLTIKYAKNVSFGKAILLCLCAPFLAIIAWLFLIFSFLDGFRNNELLNILISILIAVFICAMLILVARALYKKNKANMENEEYEAELKKELAEQEATKATDVPAQTLLLADAVNKENSEEPVVEEVSEEEIFDEEAMDSMPAVAVEEEPLAEEMEEGAEEQPTEEPVETEEVEETENNEEVEESSEEETAETNDEEDDDDEEFEAFLEALRKKAENK